MLVCKERRHFWLAIVALLAHGMAFDAAMAIDDATATVSLAANQQPAKAEEKPTATPRRAVRSRSRDRDVMLDRARQMRLAKVTPMWGDFFGGLPAIARIPGSSSTPPSDWGPTVRPGQQFTLQRGGGAAIRRFKLSEGTSALPTDRWIFNYSFFNDVGPLGDVNRYTLGWEKTFDEGLKSMEVRVPFGSTVRSRQTLGTPLQHGSQIGNMAITYKTIIGATENRLTSAGLGVAVPTGQDGQLVSDSGADLVRVRNQAVHLLPFIGWLGQKDEKLSWQVFIQLDIDTGGNPIVVLDSDGPKPAGRIRDANLLFVDVGLNYRWLEGRDAWIQDISPFIEIHYSGTLEDAPSLDFTGVNGFQVDVDPQAASFNVVNLSLGANLFTSNGLSIRPAVIVPLQQDFPDRQFDYEVGVQVNIAH